jgi:hypothetical protein
MHQGAAAEAQIAGALAELQTISEALHVDGYSYFVRATAKVGGVTFGPAYERPIQIVRPGEIAGIYL